MVPGAFARVCYWLLDLGTGGRAGCEGASARGRGRAVPLARRRSCAGPRVLLPHWTPGRSSRLAHCHCPHSEGRSPGHPLQTRRPQRLLPWALTSSTTGQGVFTITSLGLERRPVLSTPHRVNLAGGRGHGHQRELEALPRAGLCLVGGWGGRPRDPRCTYCGVRSGASHCFRGALAQATPAASGRAAGPIAVGQSGRREAPIFLSHLTGAVPPASGSALLRS